MSWFKKLCKGKKHPVYSEQDVVEYDSDELYESDDDDDDMAEPGSLSLMFWLEPTEKSEPGPARKVHCGVYCKDRYSGRHKTFHLKSSEGRRHVRSRYMICTVKGSGRIVLLEPLHRVVLSNQFVDRELRGIDMCILEMRSGFLREEDYRHCYCYQWTLKLVNDMVGAGLLPDTVIQMAKDAFTEFKVDTFALELGAPVGKHEGLGDSSCPVGLPDAPKNDNPSSHSCDSTSGYM
ncbi:hypothetical protein BXZ70DRAFT_1008261 [Cristinia sonorae]|uniref:Uncharacterized protein n=1 Tax=Cristinia sonorae TaxID=1940300 RepID=A0A8K0UQ23_9AGAR|nr:hypothetical protein BXZ70DRAFT_1008261 [Cristinia sonorae]